MSDAEGNPVMKPFWEITEQEAERCLEATTWHPAGREYMRGGGFSSKFFTRGDMPVTMCRLNLIKGQGPVLQIAEGWAVNVDRAIFEHIDKRTDPSWPTTYFAPRLTGKGAFKSVYNVMNNWGANHGAITYGHVGADLITLASMLRIPGLHAQHRRGEDLPSLGLGRLRLRPRRVRLPRLQQLRTRLPLTDPQPKPTTIDL